MQEEYYYTPLRVKGDLNQSRLYIKPLQKPIPLDKVRYFTFYSWKGFVLTVMYLCMWGYNFFPTTFTCLCVTNRVIMRITIKVLKKSVVSVVFLFPWKSWGNTMIAASIISLFVLHCILIILTLILSPCPNFVFHNQLRQDHHPLVKSRLVHQNRKSHCWPKWELSCNKSTIFIHLCSN